MNRTASIVLFLIAAALTAFLAVQSAHWLPWVKWGAWWSVMMPLILWLLVRRWRATEMRKLQARDISST